ncbi:hypothetical protein BRC81_17450 [Halobacteriales archaeon QS_1_68_20]|nr:MAG: hypothetical protein BRC81_17450 [Halobacteriales archaeon QS_1_68_20]
MAPSPLRRLVRRARERVRSRSGETRVRERVDEIGRDRLAAAAVALVAGAVVFWLATNLFPHHSANHDEGVYLQQAALLLDGNLELVAGDLAEAVRPWFFVEDGGRLYPKYAPVPAGMYAVSMALFGEPRVTLAAVAAGNAALVYVLAASAFDRRVGVVAAAVFAASPMALLTSSVFLPYAPTTLLNLLFAVCYLRGVREGSLRAARVAGVAVGLAFFARPFTAVLFAVPFVAHAAWQVLEGAYRRGISPLPDPVRRNALTGTLGLTFVGVTLAYNARLTGSPWLFPYEAFAPMDGPGFGTRRILEHSAEYTPEVALWANEYVLRYFATRWFTAGVLGTAFAAAGLALATKRWVAGGTEGGRTGDADGDRTAGVLLAGLFVAVPLGNVFFWGNRNVLGTVTDPTDGLVSLFGPFYHFDLLAPLSVFAAFALVAGWRWVRGVCNERVAPATSPRAARALGLVLLVVGVLVLGAANAAVLSPTAERNADYTAKYEAAYEPFEDADLENAVVFVPTPYGDWLAHPFQSLRNGPDLDGEVVYALDRAPASDFAVLDAYPDRTFYRYDYRGTWTPDPERHVTPKLERLEVRSGEVLDAETVVGVPDHVTRATVRLENDGEHVQYGVQDPGERIAVDWSMDGDGATLAAVENGSVAVDGTDAVVLTVTLVQPDGSTLTYRQEVTVRATGGTVEAIWPPERSVCPLVTDCGTEGTYLPDRPGVHRDGVSFEPQVEARNGTGTRVEARDGAAED